MPKPHREGGGSSPDVSRQLLLPGTRTQQYVQVGNAVPPFLARQIALTLSGVLDRHDRSGTRSSSVAVPSRGRAEAAERRLPLVAMERS